MHIVHLVISVMSMDGWLRPGRRSSAAGWALGSRESIIIQGAQTDNL